MKENHHAQRTCGAFAEGLKRHGVIVDMRSDRDHNMAGYDACVLWGFWENCQKVVAAAEAKRIPWIYLDLAYWRREQFYFKVSINDRHPTAYFNDNPLPLSRFEKLKLDISPWQSTGEYILVAGMSGKGAWSFKLPPGGYESKVIHCLSGLTNRPIIYRPKPNWGAATPIPNSRMDKVTPIERALAGAWAVVTHHSNVGVDGLLAGVPVFTELGVAVPMAYPDNCGELSLAQIEQPYRPEGRTQWAANVAHCQWTITEMQKGICWAYLKTLPFFNR